MSQIQVPLDKQLTQGERVNLSKEAPGVKLFAFGCGWNPQLKNPNEQFDVDAIAICLTGGKMASQDDLLYYGLAKSKGAPFQIHGGAIAHSGDNLTGEGDGDDESIIVDIAHANFPKSADEILIVATIYDAVNRGNQNFGRIDDCFLRIYNPANNELIKKFDLTEDYSAYNAVVVGKLYLKDGEWRFQASGEGLVGDLNKILEKY